MEEGTESAPHRDSAQPGAGWVGGAAEGSSTHGHGPGETAERNGRPTLASSYSSDVDGDLPARKQRAEKRFRSDFRKNLTKSTNSGMGTLERFSSPEQSVCGCPISRPRPALGLREGCAGSRMPAPPAGGPGAGRGRCEGRGGGPRYRQPRAVLGSPAPAAASPVALSSRPPPPVRVPGAGGPRGRRCAGSLPISSSPRARTDPSVSERRAPASLPARPGPRAETSGAERR